MAREPIIAWVVWDKNLNEIADDPCRNLNVSKNRDGARRLKSTWFGTCNRFVVKKVTIEICRKE